MLFPAVPRPPASWLAAAPVEPGQTLSSPSPVAGDLLVRYLRASGPRGWFEWVVDVDAGGRVQAWARGGPGDADDLALMADAAELTLTRSEPPPLRVDAAEPLAIDLGAPVAVLGAGQRTDAALVGRMRWLAERGLGVRLRLGMQQLPEAPRVARRVAAVRDGSGGWHRRWGSERDGLDQAERLLRGVVFGATITPDRALRTAERALLTQCLEEAFMPAAVLGGRSRAALADGDLAKALLAQIAAASPERAVDAGEAGLAEVVPIRRPRSEAS